MAVINEASKVIFVDHKQADEFRVKVGKSLCIVMGDAKGAVNFSFHCLNFFLCYISPCHLLLASLFLSLMAPFAAEH